MSDFDYVKGYDLLAKPAFLALSDRQKEFHSRLSKIVAQSSQGHDLNIPIDTWVQGYIDEYSDLTDKELAEIARASYYVGHWFPYREGEKRLFPNASGESWKVANVIDQLLRKRLFGGKFGSYKGYGCEIHEGIITKSTPNSWKWEELCLATRDNYKFLHDNGLKGNDLKERANNFIKQIGDLWDIKTIEFYPDNVEYKYKAMLKDSMFDTQGIHNVNFKPHPYVIGNLHMQYSEGMYLDVEGAEKKGAHCYHKELGHSYCSIPYAEHKSDKVLFLQLNRNAANDEATKVLQSITDEMQKDKIDGVTLIESEEQYRIG